MPDTRGHIELERTIDSIVVGIRHRKDAGDIEALARSIEEVGLLQPITITPDGVLVCGWRRLEAVRRLGWTTLKVWVRSGISDQLSHLLAQQDENEHRKPLTPLETAELYAEIKRLLAEDGQRRQEATRFGAGGGSDGVNGAEGPTAPRGSGDSRNQASRMITGAQSFARLEQINWIRRISCDTNQPESIRTFARNMLTEIDNDAPVEPAYKRVRAAVELASTPDPEVADPDDVKKLGEAALARVRQQDARKGLRALKRKPTGMPFHRSLRSFILMWTELEGWSELYDPHDLAGALSDEEWERFERVVAETVEFRERLRVARNDLASA